MHELWLNAQNGNNYIYIKLHIEYSCITKQDTEHSANIPAAFTQRVLFLVLHVKYCVDIKMALKVIKSTNISRLQHVAEPSYIKKNKKKKNERKFFRGNEKVLAWTTFQNVAKYQKFYGESLLGHNTGD